MEYFSIWRVWLRGGCNPSLYLSFSFFFTGEMVKYINIYIYEKTYTKITGCKQTPALVAHKRQRDRSLLMVPGVEYALFAQFIFIESIRYVKILQTIHLRCIKRKTVCLCVCMCIGAILHQKISALWITTPRIDNRNVECRSRKTSEKKNTHNIKTFFFSFIFYFWHVHGIFGD